MRLESMSQNSAIEKRENVKSIAHALLRFPGVYRSFQAMVGRRDNWPELAEAHFPWLSPKNRVLDIGCGPGSLLQNNSLPITHENFTGIDVSQEYITSARNDFPDATFHLGTVREAVLPANSFDLVIMSGVCHHMDDTQVTEALVFALAMLKPGGTFFTIDPVVFPGQNLLAK